MPFSISKPTSCSRKPALLHVLERPLADEVVLVELDDPRHARLEDVRLGVGVLADEDVHLLEAEDPLRLEPERPDAEVGARARGSRPRRARRTGSGSGSRSRARRRSRCAGCRDGTPATCACLRVEVGKRLVRDVEVGEARMSSSRARGPATLTAASAPVTLTISTSMPPDRVPPLEPLDDRVGAGGGRRHVERRRRRGGRSCRRP